MLRFGLDEESGAAGDGGAGDGTPAEGPVFERVAGQQSRPGGRAAVVGSVTLAVLLAAGMGFPHSGKDPAYGGLGAGSVDGPEGVAADSSVADRAGFTQQEPAQMSISRNSVRATIVAGAALIAASAGAQSAVQWKVSDGGNGHWYALCPLVASWPVLQAEAERQGGHLVTLNNAQEWTWTKSNFEIPYQTGRFVGAYQDRNASDYSEPAGGWRWVNGEPFHFDASYMRQFDDACGNQQVMIYQGCCNQFLDDIQNGVEPGCDSFLRQAIFEWDADCNTDGIVDYGQILDGTFTDANSNGVPDCCEQGVPCSSCHLYDLNLNGSVDGADLGVLLAFWGPVSPAFPRADINGDGRVDGSDLGLLLSNWGPCPQ